MVLVLVSSASRLINRSLARAPRHVLRVREEVTSACRVTAIDGEEEWDGAGADFFSQPPH